MISDYMEKANFEDTGFAYCTGTTYLRKTG